MSRESCGTDIARSIFKLLFLVVLGRGGGNKAKKADGVGQTNHGD